MSKKPVCQSSDAVKLLTVAAVYAEDGAIHTALDRAKRAVALLETLAEERTKWLREIGAA